MKLQKILPLSAILVVFAALPSFAGSTYVENSYNLRSTFNGKSHTNVNVDEIYSGHRSATSSATKKVASTTTTTEAKDGRTFNETDVADIYTTSSSSEAGNFTNTTAVRQTESYDFSGFSKDHRVTSGYNF
ncbi:MAG: hypothetical protein ACFCU8_09195 [Thermosynechococcaceae cyanobacterium]